MFFENLRFALASLLSNKLRSLLTMLGIIIGVGAVVAMISIGSGATRHVTEQFASLGANVLTVAPGFTQPAGGGRRQLYNIKYEDYLALKEANLPGVVGVTVQAASRSVVQYGGENTYTSVMGTTPSYAPIRDVETQKGRFINDYDVSNASRVAVLGVTVVEDLWGDPAADPVGEKLRVGNENYTVIGVLEDAEGFVVTGDQVLVPVTTAHKRITGNDNLQTIAVQAENPQVLPQTEAALTSYLTRRLGGSDRFRLTNMQQILDQIEASTQTLTILLAGITGISLLVGGIGIMNIMLVSVTERTREIGIRKAIGAKRRHILSQFVLESTLLSLIGGAIGIALGIWGATGISRAGGWEAAISVQAIVLAVGFSGAVGMFFGIYPANKASKLDPIDALRYE